jgi:hypothetical protein
MKLVSTKSTLSKLPVVLIFGAILLLSSQALASNWDPNYQDNGCITTGVRKYSSRLWNIPWGADWELACANKSWGGWGKPTLCRNMGASGMWGVWHIQDPSCG